MPSAWFYAYAWCPHHIFCINNAQLLLLLGSYLNIVFALKVCTYPETVIMLMGRFSLRVVSVFFDDRFLIHKHSDLTIKMCSHMERVIYLKRFAPRNNLILGKIKRKKKCNLAWLGKVQGYECVRCTCIQKPIAQIVNIPPKLRQTKKDNSSFSLTERKCKALCMYITIRIAVQSQRYGQTE